jgi:hypothetical protein
MLFCLGFLYCSYLTLLCSVGSALCKLCFVLVVLTVLTKYYKKSSDYLLQYNQELAKCFFLEVFLLLSFLFVRNLVYRIYMFFKTSIECLNVLLTLVKSSIHLDTSLNVSKKKIKEGILSAQLERIELLCNECEKEMLDVDLFPHIHSYAVKDERLLSDYIPKLEIEDLEGEDVVRTEG